MRLFNCNRVLLFVALGILPCTRAPASNVIFLNGKAVHQIVGTGDETSDWYVRKLPSNDGLCVRLVYGDAPLCFLVPFKSMKVSGVLKSPGKCGFLGREHRFVAWTSDFAHDLSFPNAKLDLNQGDPPPYDTERFEFDFAGDYFALEKSGSASVFLVSRPKGNPLVTFKGRSLKNIFSTGNRLLMICGVYGEEGVECTILSKSDMRVIRRFMLSDVQKVFDWSPDGTQLLVGTPGNWMIEENPPYRHYIVDLSTMKRTRIYQKGEYGFFTE